jgi:hypothetical protein
VTTRPPTHAPPPPTVRRTVFFCFIHSRMFAASNTAPSVVHTGVWGERPHARFARRSRTPTRHTRTVHCDALTVNGARDSAHESNGSAALQCVATPARSQRPPALRDAPTDTPVVRVHESQPLIYAEKPIVSRDNTTRAHARRYAAAAPAPSSTRLPPPRSRHSVAVRNSLSFECWFFPMPSQLHRQQRAARKVSELTRGERAASLGLQKGRMRPSFAPRRGPSSGSARVGGVDDVGGGDRARRLDSAAPPLRPPAPSVGSRTAQPPMPPLPPPPLPPPPPPLPTGAHPSGNVPPAMSGAGQQAARGTTAARRSDDTRRLLSVSGGESGSVFVAVCRWLLPATVRCYAGLHSPRRARVLRVSSCACLLWPLADVWAALGDSLVSSLEPLPGSFLRDRCIATVEDVLTQWLLSVGGDPNWHGPVVVQFGSTALGVAEALSDVDVLVGFSCVPAARHGTAGEDTRPLITPGRFFGEFPVFLQEQLRYGDVDARYLCTPRSVLHVLACVVKQAHGPARRHGGARPRPDRVLCAAERQV